MIKQKLLAFYISFKEALVNCRLCTSDNTKLDRIEAEIIRSVHSIEKGLCLENPRPGFGVGKINDLFNDVELYEKLNKEDKFCLYMARDAVRAYLDYHKKNNFSNEHIETTEQRFQRLNDLLPAADEVYGGFHMLSQEDMDYDTKTIEKLFKTRHSIREFSGEPVDQQDIQKAIQLAQFSPSACNRQCTRVYFVDKEKYMREMDSDLQGIGGFAEDADGFLLVTGKQSAYRLGERHQHIVSASIFAGYLSLALHAYSIACCVVQRSLSPNSRWDRFKRINSIPEDEQIVLMLAIGKYKEKTSVPVSKRFPLKKIYRVLK